MRPEAEDAATTRALRFRVDPTSARPAVTPLYQNSAFEAGSPFFYTRKANPNVVELEGVVAELEGARHAVAVSTGMAAIAVVASRLRPRARVVVGKLVYGCSLKYLRRLEERLELTVVSVDLATPEGRAALAQPTDLVFFETPTNPFLRTVDIESVARAAKAAHPRALVVVDNTWATPLFQKPLRHGADLSVYSATKYFSGHSDVMGGLIVTDDAELAAFARDERFFAGAVLDPHSAWLLRRSLCTLPLRMREHARVTRDLAAFLATLPQIASVHLPEVDGRQLVDYGGIVFVTLRADLVDRYEQLTRELRLFGTGTGMACVTSMIAQPYTGSHASLTPDEKAAMGLGRDLVRLCFGLEEPEDLKRDLGRALAAIDASGRIG
jgi:cystathionine beta-lyase/cystathionine gamma-synthase